MMDLRPLAPLAVLFSILLLAPIARAQTEIGQIGCLDDGSNCTEHVYGLGFDSATDSVQVVIQRANPAGSDCSRHAGTNPVKGQMVIRERTDTPPGEPIDVEIPLQDEIIGLNGVATDARSFWSLSTRSYQTAAFLGALRLDNFGVVYVEGARGQRHADPSLGPNATRIDWDGDGKLGTCSESETPCSHPNFCPLNADRACERSADETGAPMPCGPGVGACPDDAEGAQGCLQYTANDEVCVFNDDLLSDLMPHFYLGGSCCDSTNDVLCQFLELPEYPILAARNITIPARYVTDFLFPSGGAGTDFRSAEETYPLQRWGICETNGTRFGQLGDRGCSAAEIPSVCSDAPDFSICNTTSDCQALGWSGECVPRTCSDPDTTCKIRQIGLNFGEEVGVTNSDGTPDSSRCQTEGVHFVGMASGKCSIAEEVWLGLESGPAPDPTPYCALGNYGLEARPDLDCDGTIDGPDLCPNIIEENPLLDRNEDGVGDECQCGDPNGTGRYESADLLAAFLCLAAPLPGGSCRVNADIACVVDSDCPLFDPDNDPLTPAIETCTTPILELIQPCFGFLPHEGMGIARADTNGTGLYESADLLAIFGALSSQAGESLECLLRSSPLLGSCSSDPNRPCSTDVHCFGGTCIPAAP